jgi:hypothetical protein
MSTGKRFRAALLRLCFVLPDLIYGNAVYMINLMALIRLGGAPFKRMGKTDSVIC